MTIPQVISNINNMNTIIDPKIKKQEHLHNMFALAVLCKAVELRNDERFFAETFNEKFAEYVVESALDLNLLSEDERGMLSLNDLDRTIKED